MDSRYIHIHADPRCPPLTVHDSHCGDDIDQGGCQPAVQRPSPVRVLLFYPHFTHHLTGASRQNIHLKKTQRNTFLTRSSFNLRSVTEIRVKTKNEFTFLSTLSKPGLSTINLITCFKEFNVSEVILNYTL